MTTTLPAPWWRTAPNPGCPSFCTYQHAPDELTRGGALLCRAVIASSELFEVEIQVISTGEDCEPGEVVRDPVAVFLESTREGREILTEMTP